MSLCCKVSWKAGQLSGGYSLATKIIRFGSVGIFSFGGYIKHNIWNVHPAQQPSNTRQLQAAIVRECHNFPQTFIQNTFDGMVN